MRRTQPSSDLLSRQRYCITTGQVSCCSGTPGATGPAGPAGPGISCGIVYSGITTGRTDPDPSSIIAGAGAYWLQRDDADLHISTGSSWTKLVFSTPIYFLDTATNIMYFAVDVPPSVTVVDDLGLLVGCRDRNLYEYNTTTQKWEVCCNISPATKAISNSPVAINTLSDAALLTTTVTHGLTGMSAQLSASVYLTGLAGETGQGYIYLSAAGVTGTKFPYTSGTTFPETYTISETFAGLPLGASTVGLYGYNTGISASGAGNLSVLYNVTPGV